MPSFVSTIFATGFALTVSASALPPRVGTPDSTSFSVTQVRNSRYVRHGPLALAKAYQKYGAPLPSDLHAAVANLTRLGRRATGSVATTPVEFDVEYLS